MIWIIHKIEGDGDCAKCPAFLTCNMKLPGQPISRSLECVEIMQDRKQQIILEYLETQFDLKKEGVL